MFVLLGLMLCFPLRGTGLPDLEQMFMRNQVEEFSLLLAPQVRIETDLRPILYDHGDLSRQQVLWAFAKLHDRYLVRDAVITNFQSDTNYAWLEIYLDLALEEKRTGIESHIIFAFHFKISASQMAIYRWILQDHY